MAIFMRDRILRCFPQARDDARTLSNRFGDGAAYTVRARRGV
jgi:hypothetical protein